MKLIDIALVLIIALLLFLCIKYLTKRNKKGCCSGCSGCAGCSHNIEACRKDQRNFND